MATTAIKPSPAAFKKTTVRSDYMKYPAASASTA
jgi:hypothetical protein